MSLQKACLKAIFLLCLGILIGSCGPKDDPIILPGNKVLEHISVDFDKVSVTTLNEKGEKVPAQLQSIHDKYAISQAYLLEIYDRLDACPEVKKMAKEVRALNPDMMGR